MNRGQKCTQRVDFRALGSKVAIHPHELKCIQYEDLRWERSEDLGLIRAEETGGDRVGWLR